MVVHSALRALGPVDGGAETVIRALRECVGDSGTLSLFTGHEAAGMPCGPDTPWWRLAAMGGSILLLGVTQQNNTSIHGPEEVHAGYQLSTDLIEGVVIDAGVEYRVRSRLHRWGNASDARINPWLENAGGLRRGRVGNADCLLIDAGIFQAQVIARLVDNPRFLLV
jgi:aminoglycoside 3-N-acetyltransferase